MSPACTKCGHELSDPDDTHLCQPITEPHCCCDRDWPRAGYVGHQQGCPLYFTDPARELVQMDPTHVSAMEDVCEAVSTACECCMYDSEPVQACLNSGCPMAEPKAAFACLNEVKERP